MQRELGIWHLELGIVSGRDLASRNWTEDLDLGKEIHLRDYKKAIFFSQKDKLGIGVRAKIFQSELKFVFTRIVTSFSN